MHKPKTSSNAEKENNSSQSSSENDNERKPPIIDKIWMIRECSEYYKEYKVCKKWKSHLYRYYREEDNQECKDWKSDYENCEKYKASVKDEHAQPIIDHEVLRIRKRLMAAKHNDVWEYRHEPPAFWDTPIDKTPTDFQNLDKSNVSYSKRCTIS